MATTPSGITSLREATFEHQAYAMSQGYNSTLECLVDEMAASLRDLRARVEALEGETEPKIEEET